MCSENSLRLPFKVKFVDQKWGKRLGFKIAPQSYTKNSRGLRFVLHKKVLHKREGKSSTDLQFRANTQVLCILHNA